MGIFTNVDRRNYMEINAPNMSGAMNQVITITVFFGNGTGGDIHLFKAIVHPFVGFAGEVGILYTSAN